MSFKMKRAGMNLRSTTGIQPQLSNVQSSPFKQAPVPQVTMGDNGEVQANLDTPAVPPTEPTTGDDGSFGRACKGINDGSTQVDTVTGKKIKCTRSTDPNYTPPVTTEGTEGTEATSDVGTGRVEGPGGTTPRTNILTPREMRRNQRMVRLSSRGNEDAKRLANRNIRQAVRRGESPDQGDLDILSGKSLGNLDGINVMQDSTGTTNLWTKQKTAAFQQNPGGEEMDPEVYQAELMKQAQTLSESGDYGDGDMQKMMDEAAKLTKAGLNVGEDGKQYDAGQYLTNRTRRTMKRYDADMKDAGDYKDNKKSQKKKDRHARQVKNISSDLKQVVDSDGNFNPKNEAGMSKKKYDRKKRRITKKGGDVSAFKKKGSPMHMTVNVTKPSYKMGGFGSK